MPPVGGGLGSACRSRPASSDLREKSDRILQGHCQHAVILDVRRLVVGPLVPLNTAAGLLAPSVLRASGVTAFALGEDVGDPLVTEPLPIVGERLTGARPGLVSDVLLGIHGVLLVVL